MSEAPLYTQSYSMRYESGSSSGSPRHPDENLQSQEGTGLRV